MKCLIFSILLTIFHNIQAYSIVSCQVMSKNITFDPKNQKVLSISATITARFRTQSSKISKLVPISVSGQILRTGIRNVIMASASDFLLQYQTKPNGIIAVPTESQLPTVLSVVGVATIDGKRPFKCYGNITLIPLRDGVDALQSRNDSRIQGQKQAVQLKIISEQSELNPQRNQVKQQPIQNIPLPSSLYSVRQPIYRYHRISNDYTEYYFTRQVLQAQTQWTLDGIAFYNLFKFSNSLPIYQFYQNNPSGHRCMLYPSMRPSSYGWTYDGIAFWAPQQPIDSEMKPVYMFYKDIVGGTKFVYSMDDGWKKDGWTQQGFAPVFYAYEGEVKSEIRKEILTAD